MAREGRVWAAASKDYDTLLFGAPRLVRFLTIAGKEFLPSQGTFRPLIPEVLELDLRDGQAWVAVTPFRITGLRMRGLPPLPGSSNFLELNVRSYVRYQNRPGVFFFSLDAASLLAVMGARAGYHLPYYYARMRQNAVVTGLEAVKELGENIVDRVTS